VSGADAAVAAIAGTGGLLIGYLIGRARRRGGRLRVYVDYDERQGGDGDQPAG
jgi:hypothetical protein